MRLYYRIKWLLHEGYYEVKYAFQRFFRGYGDDEIINLDVALARWILPRLRAFRDAQPGIPGDVVRHAYGLLGIPVDKMYEANDRDAEAFSLARDIWNEKLDYMIEGFEEVLEDLRPNREGDKRKIQTALTLLAEHYRGLWL